MTRNQNKQGNKYRGAVTCGMHIPVNSQCKAHPSYEKSKSEVAAVYEESGQWYYTEISHLYWIHEVYCEHREFVYLSWI